MKPWGSQPNSHSSNTAVLLTCCAAAALLVRFFFAHQTSHSCPLSLRPLRAQHRLHQISFFDGQVCDPVPESCCWCSFLSHQLRLRTNCWEQTDIVPSVWIFTPCLCMVLLTPDEHSPQPDTVKMLKTVYRQWNSYQEFTCNFAGGEEDQAGGNFVDWTKIKKGSKEN